MKILKIDQGKGQYSIDGRLWKELDMLSKEDLLTLINLVVTIDTEMDAFDEEKIQHPAHRIIYRNLYGKLDSLTRNRKRFADESEALYREALGKYRTLIKEGE